MIESFKCKETEKIFYGERSRKFLPAFQQLTRRKLKMLHHAQNINDLRVPPGNRLERLSGDRAGQHSIRINLQYRLCFTWDDGNAFEVEIVDYH